MDKLRLLKNENFNHTQKRKYSQIKQDLEKRLSLVRSEADISDLTSYLTGVFQNEILATDEKNDLKNFRQKIYDHRRKIKKSLTPLNNNSTSSNQNTSTKNVICPRCQHQEEKTQITRSGLVVEISNKHSFLNIFKKKYSELLICLFTSFAFASCALLTMWFVWKQSIPLYEATGFTDPKFSAFGAILMRGVTIIGTKRYSKQKSLGQP